MASKKAKQKKVLEKAKQLVLKNKKGKAKAKPKQRYPEGQNAPQSKAYQIDNDKTQVAKATGWRFTKEGAKRLGKTESDRPTQAEVEKYRNQTFKVKGKVNKSGPKGTGDGSFRYIYIERRADKADLKRNQKLAHGGSIKEKRERVIDYYLNNDVFDDPYTYDLSDEDLEDAKKSKSYKKIEDAIVKYHGLDDDENVEERFETLGLEDDEYAKGGKTNELYEHFEYINENGKALDDYFNDYLDEDGEVVYVPQEDWHLFKMVDENNDIIESHEYAKGGKTKKWDKGVELVNQKTATNDEQVWNLLNKTWKKYNIVNSREFDLETPYNRGWVNDGDSINVYLVKKGDKYYWDWEKSNKMAHGGETAELKLLVDSRHGVYVPKVFVEQYDLKKFGISDEDAKYYKEAFENPDSDEYYDAWDDLLREAKTKDGETITQADGDLFLVPEGYEYDDFYAKGGKTKNLPTKQDVLHFQEYVFSFYGKGGLQADAFDGGATTEEILLATNQYLTFCARNTDLWGGGDTADREYVRDIMLYHRGVDIDDLFYGNLIKKIKKTTILEYGGILQPMIGGVNADPRFDIYNTTMFAEDGAMLDDGKKMRRGGFVTTMDDLIASAELIHYATAKMKEGDADKVLNFAYTDYGGDFFDKVAIEYFEEEYPDNIVVENTMYSGKNAIVFGEPAREFAEASERYLLGFEGIEDFYYQKQYEQEREDFERFLEDMEKYNNYKASPEAINWLMENKSGYYTILPSGLDYSESDLEEELVNEGLLEKNEEMAKGGKTKGRVEEDSDDVARKQQKNLIRRVKKQINEDRVDNWYEAIEELLSFAPKNDLADYVGTRSSDKKLLEKGAKKIAKDVFAKDENADELLSLIPIKNLATFIGDDDEYARGGKIKDQYKQFPKGSFKREKGVWNAWTPTQRLHFLNDHARELLHFGWGIAESDFGKISKLDYDGLMDEDNTGDSEIFVSVNDALNKHIREGQYADGGKTMSRKVLTRRYLQGRAQNVFTFGYGMPKDAIDMYGTKGGSEYFVMPNGDVYKKTTADMHKFELIDVKDKS